MNPKDNPPRDVAAKVRAVMREWCEENPQQICHVIANNSEVDCRKMNLAEAGADSRLARYLSSFIIGWLTIMPNEAI